MACCTSKNVVSQKSTYRLDYMPFDKRLSDEACRDPSDPPPPKPRRNTVPDDCFDRCRLSPEGKEARRALFASKFWVSEYQDNINRIGHMIMNTNFHCHQKCLRRTCEHPFVVDLNKDIFRKPKCKYTNVAYGGFKSEFKPKPDCYNNKC